MKKNVLIVTHWFYPFNVPRAFRSTALAKKLFEKNYNVDIINLNTKTFFNMKDFKENNEDIRDSSSKFRSKYFSKINVVFEFFFGERHYFTRIKYLDSFQIDEYDVVLSVGLPFYVHRLVSKKLKKSNWDGVSIADWSDPYYKSHVKLAPYFKKIQRTVLSEFDYTVIPVEEAKDYYLDFIPSERIRVIPQGFYMDNLNLIEYKENPIITFAYAGIFYKNIRNPEKLLNYLSKCDDDFRFYVFTLLKGEVYEEILKKYKLILGEKLVLCNMIDRENLITKMSKMDFLLNVENLTNNQSPSKLIDYTLSGRPILSISPNLDDLDNLENFLSRDYTNQTSINLSKYDINNVVLNFEELFGD